jgi:3-hydroxyacyl-CoA dehydrogenase/enoyl-CoA hydratase/3-hydroxybutyryl-CoA epimerase
MSIVFQIQDNIGSIEFDLPDSKVNLLTADVIRRLDAILDELKNKETLDAVLIRSKKKDIFIAGADIKEIENITGPKDGEGKSRAGQDVLNKLEDLKVPTVAVINGATLGGGCELALACRYRVATFSDKVKIGLPEVNLGIVPGFGGTYRMPRVVGLMQALKLTTSGKALSGRDALRIGLVDRLFPEIGLDAQLRKFIHKIKENPQRVKSARRRKPKLLQAFLEKTPVGQTIACSQARKTILKLTKGFYPAPLKAVSVLSKSVRMDRRRALELEARAFGELVITDVSKNLIKLFYLSEKFKKLSPKEIEGVHAKPVEKCAVVGAGIMGGGIAQVLGYKDIHVRIKDIRYEAIAQALKTAGKIFYDAVKKRRLTPAQAAVKMARISGTLDYSGFKNADIVIEAVVEEMSVKKKVFKELGEAAPRAVLCTNTSALSVTEMAKETKDPSRVVGLHFFNPVHRMPLVEIIRTELTSPETMATALNLVKRLGKTPILVKDSRGFLVNRVLLAYVNEAGRLLEETGELENIDKAVAAFGMPMGPFELSDEVGLDVGIKVLHILEEAFGERFKPGKLFEEVYRKKWFGKKTGRGFYLHEKKRRVNPGILSLLPARPANPWDETEVLDRLIFIMVNEAARCLEEGVVDGPGTVDIGMIMGTGFPAFRGGLLRYADHLGIPAVVVKLLALKEKYGHGRFEPCSYLLDLREKKRGFFS